MIITISSDITKISTDKTPDFIVPAKVFEMLISKPEKRRFFLNKLGMESAVIADYNSTGINKDENFLYGRENNYFSRLTLGTYSFANRGGYIV